MWKWTLKHFTVPYVNLRFIYPSYVSSLDRLKDQCLHLRNNNSRQCLG